MSTQFEFRLSGSTAPEGELEADHLLALVESLKTVATRISRVETEAERLGRAPRRTQQVARLLIGLKPGSTCVLARRAGVGDDALDFDLAQEQAFDDKFAAIVQALADDERPDWVDDSLALASADLATALRQAATQVEFRVDDEVRRTFDTASMHLDTWRVQVAEAADEVTFIGQLFAVNLRTHRLQIQDDLGNQVALPKVADDAAAGRLLGTYVSVAGRPRRDAQGRVVEIREGVVEPAPEPFDGAGLPEAVTVDEILASAPGIEPGGLGLSDEESDRFFDAMGF